MSRFFAGLCVLILLFSTLAAQESETPEPINPTPELLGLLDRSEKILDAVEKPEEKAMLLFEMLTYELRLTEKEPARKTIRKIQALVPSLEKDSTRQQINTTLAFALCKIDDIDAAIQVANKIDNAASRAEVLLNLVEKMIDSKDNKQSTTSIDLVPLLQLVVAGGKEGRDPGLEAIGSALLGQQLAQQGRTDEARNAFRDARNKARELEEIEERDVIALIVRGEVQSGMIPEATALIESIADEDKKEAFWGITALTLARAGNLEGYKKYLALLKPGDVKDNVLIGVASEWAPTADAATLAELMNQISKPDRKSLFLNAIVPILADKTRLDVISTLANETDNPTEFNLTVKVIQLEKLLQDQKFDEADKLVASFDDDRLRQAGARHVILGKMKSGQAASTDPSKTVEALAEATLSDDEKEALAELTSQIKALSDLAEPTEKLSGYLEILQAQLGLFDLKGAKQTLGMMIPLVENAEDPIQIISNRMIMSRFQAELGDKQAALENTDKLLKFLADVKDIGVLQDLVLAEEAPQADDQEESNQPLLNIKTPADPSQIKEALVKLYLSIADAQAQAGGFAEARKTLQIAETKIDAELSPEKKFAMLFLITQMLGEFDTVEKKQIESGR